VEQGRLTRARRPHDGGEHTGGEAEVHTVKGENRSLTPPVALADPSKLNSGRTSGRRSSSGESD
jgi:hypothetical protein